MHVSGHTGTHRSSVTANMYLIGERYFWYRYVSLSCAVWPGLYSEYWNHFNNATHAKTPQTCYSLLHLQAWYRYVIIAVSDCCRLQTVQNWRYQIGTVCWVVRAVSVWYNRVIQVCWEQTVAVCKNRLWQAWWTNSTDGSCWYQINQDWWIQMIKASVLI